MKLITSLILALVPIAVLIRDWKFRDRRTRRHHQITRGILVAWTIASLASIFFVWQETRESSSLKQKVNTLVQGKDELIEVNKQLSSSLEEKTKEIIYLNEKNSILYEHTYKYMTGYDSYCYFEHFHNVINPPNIITRQLVHVGKYPLYDLHIRIFDVNSFKNTPIYKDTLFFSGQANINVNIEHIKLPTDIDHQKYSIFFQARNGIWHQNVSFRRVDGKWKLAMWVGGEEKRLKEYVSEDFPRDVDGKVLW